MIFLFISTARQTNERFFFFSTSPIIAAAVNPNLVKDHRYYFEKNLNLNFCVVIVEIVGYIFFL